MSLREARASIIEALKQIKGIRYYEDPANDVDPPATVLGAAALTWDGMCSEPTGAEIQVYVLHALDERAAERLPDLALTVAAALDALPGVVVQRANPGVFNVGQQLPSYEITLEVAL